MPNTRQILIVDDDPELRDALSEQLSLYEEFKAFAAEDGSKGVQAAKAGQIDLVIMDVGLPDIDGREAVRILRKNGFKAPIIMLTGHDTDSDTILGLELGGIWINFSEPLDNFCVFRTNLLFEAANFGVKRINRLCIVLLLGAPYLVLELPDIAVGPQLDFVPVDCLNDLLHIGDSRWYSGSRIVTLRSRNHRES